MKSHHVYFSHASLNKIFTTSANFGDASLDHLCNLREEKFIGQ